ncbi:hypothetical protein FACS1894184_02030 [Clostridia bacterium]|nr:hypothetical protein FACS1894184_02030 [Clostridia bacterium]
MSELPRFHAPDFSQMLKALNKQRTDRPVLFELFMNDPLYARLTGKQGPSGNAPIDRIAWMAEAFRNAGYDYVTTHASAFGFSKHAREHKRTLSLNDSESITTWESFESFNWDDPLAYDTSHYGKLEGVLPEGMKCMVMGPGGVLENVIALVGYDNLCYMLYEDRELVSAITDKVGSALLKYYEDIAGYDSVGFLCSNDDWGFNTQTFLSTDDMREFIFPWHKKIVQLAHRHGKPVMLHSCGAFDAILGDIIDDIGFDARHSYEDKIVPVEDAYERIQKDYNGRIAVLGGMDMDFICRSEPSVVQSRAEAMLERTKDRGGYALGTGNSVPEYIPFEGYLAMLKAAAAFGR